MRWPDRGIGLHCFHHAYTRVTHPNGSQLALLEQPLHGLPHQLDARRTRAHIVDQEQIQIAIVSGDLLDALETFLVRGFRILGR